MDLTSRIAMFDYIYEIDCDLFRQFGVHWGALNRQQSTFSTLKAIAFFQAPHVLPGTIECLLETANEVNESRLRV